MLGFSAYKRCPVCGGHDDCEYCDAKLDADGWKRAKYPVRIGGAGLVHMVPQALGLFEGEWSGARADRTKDCEPKK